jgi:hypothetical protein
MKQIGVSYFVASSLSSPIVFGPKASTFYRIEIFSMKLYAVLNWVPFYDQFPLQK